MPELVQTHMSEIYHIVKSRRFGEANEWSLMPLLIDFWCQNNPIPFDAHKQKTKIVPHEAGKYKNKICKQCIILYRRHHEPKRK